MRPLVLCFVILLLVAGSLAGENTMPVSEIEPGMRGVGKTVFAGNDIETFEFEVLDILPNFRSKRDLILVKLIGEQVSHTNVVAGMSGSPMYIDGKLIGALAYRMGLFLKEPIAGITPIAQMLEILEREKVRKQELALNRGTNWDYVDMAVGAAAPSLEKLIPERLKQRRAERQSDIAPLETPLLFSGFEPGALELAEKIFSHHGFEVQHGGGSSISTEATNAKPFEPGAAYSVVVVDGDLGLQATGTVTYVDGEQVIGMGHPFMNGGAVGLPMGHAKILTTISSYMASTKLSAMTQIVGTVHQDRSTGVMGVNGEEPRMLPFRLSLTSPVMERVEFNFRIAEDRSLHSLTPLIFSIVLTNALESARLTSSGQTLKLDGKVNLKGYDPILLDNYYAGGAPASFTTDATEAASEIAAIIGALLSNTYEQPEIESIELHFESLPKRRIASVEKVVVDRTTVEPGDAVTVTAYVKEYQGEQHKYSQILTIPAHLQGRRINIFAGSGDTLTRLETRSAPHKYRPQSFEHLMNLLKNRKRNNLVFFQVRLPDLGVTWEGSELPGLPPSILSIMRSQKASGALAAVRDRVVAEDQVETNYSVSGGKTVWLKVEQK